MLKIKAKIIDVDKQDSSVSTIVQGMKHGEKPYGATAGGHGTYRLGYPEGYHWLFVIISLFNSKFCEYQKIKIDVRELTRQVNGWTKITEPRVERLRDKLLNKDVDIENIAKGKWQLVDAETIVATKIPLRAAQYSAVFAPPQHYNSVDEYLKNRFKSIRELRDLQLSYCPKISNSPSFDIDDIDDLEAYSRAYDRIMAKYPYTDSFLDKPVGTIPTDSDYGKEDRVKRIEESIQKIMKEWLGKK